MQNNGVAFQMPGFFRKHRFFLDYTDNFDVQAVITRNNAKYRQSRQEPTQPLQATLISEFRRGSRHSVNIRHISGYFNPGAV